MIPICCTSFHKDLFFMRIKLDRKSCNVIQYNAFAISLCDLFLSFQSVPRVARQACTSLISQVGDVVLWVPTNEDHFHFCGYKSIDERASDGT